VSWEQDGKRQIGYWIGRKFWGKGIASQALAQFLVVVKARPLYAYVAKHNTASIRVLEKNGFTISVEDSQFDSTNNEKIEEVLFQLI
jgi:RimJ/RimL family protein N-acetyltransferase